MNVLILALREGGGKERYGDALGLRGRDRGAADVAARVLKSAVLRGAKSEYRRFSIYIWFVFSDLKFFFGRTVRGDC